MFYKLVSQVYAVEETIDASAIDTVLDNEVDVSFEKAEDRPSVLRIATAGAAAQLIFLGDIPEGSIKSDKELYSSLGGACWEVAVQESIRELEANRSLCERLEEAIRRSHQLEEHEILAVLTGIPTPQWRLTGLRITP